MRGGRFKGLNNMWLLGRPGPREPPKIGRQWGPRAPQIWSNGLRKSLDFEIGVGGAVGCPYDVQVKTFYSQYKMPPKGPPRLAPYHHNHRSELANSFRSAQSHHSVLSAGTGKVTVPSDLNWEHSCRCPSPAAWQKDSTNGKRGAMLPTRASDPRARE